MSEVIVAETDLGEPVERVPRWQLYTTPLMLFGTVLVGVFGASVVISGERETTSTTVVRLELPAAKPWNGPGFQLPIF